MLALFQPMPAIEWNGPEFRYIIEYYRQDVDNPTRYTATIMKPEEYHYVVPNTVNVPTYTPWTIRVKARNAVGDAIEPVKEVTGYSERMVSNENKLSSKHNISQYRQSTKCYNQ